MGEFVQLRFHGGDDFRVPVPRVHHADTAGKIDKFAPVGGFERGVLCAFHKPVAADGSAFGQMSCKRVFKSVMFEILLFGLGCWQIVNLFLHGGAAFCCLMTVGFCV